MPPAIHIENVGKSYRLGLLHTRSLRDLGNSAVARLFRRSPPRHERPHRNFWALRNVSFDVEPGEVVGIIGKNGAGKSTLLKILSNVTPPDTGRIEIRGRVASLLEVGTGFHPELTGRENVFLNGTILGMTKSEIRRQFDAIVAFSEIDKFIDTPVKRYSSGMYVRLAFAVAAHLEPEVLVVDEVLAVGDVDFQKKCLGRMQTVAREGRTVFFVSHNTSAILRLCSRAVLLQAGAVAFDGAAADAVAEYTRGRICRQAQVTLPPPDRSHTPGYAVSATIEDESGQPTTEIPFRSAWQLRIIFRITQPVSHFVIAVGVTTRSEVPVSTTWAPETDIEPGEYCAVFRHEAIGLACGDYTVHVGLSQYHRNFYYSDNAIHLSIANANASLQPVLADTFSGILVNPMRVDIQRTMQDSI